jgi:GNAT superfamily N-acetyltransferase
MQLHQTTSLTPYEKEAIRSVWNGEYPVKLTLATMQDMEEYFLGLQNARHSLLMDGDNVAAWAADFDRDNERWFAIIVDGKYQRAGLGGKLLDHLKQHNAVLNGWVADHNNDLKQNGAPYISPLSFYLKHGFEVLADVRLELEKLSAVKIRWTKSRL